jgi:hypothetical protein
MTDINIVPAVAGLAFVAFLVSTAVCAATERRHLWRLPAIASLVYLLFTLRAVFIEGPLGFWPEHTRNLWGNQIWLDLLLAASVGWSFIAPNARALGMRLIPWSLLIICTGSVGFLAFAARVLYLREGLARGVGGGEPASRAHAELGRVEGAR